ncbi:type II secretion system minor pseudopilin GspI [Lacimicrobium alkaliphilum]|uniref:Type II secretion system protein I n=1 Tax=Lacimicrobium alkaliphilum TaxID=1526571 RepID=A0ABQ1RS55_9ALTE|nr:type II secretion system minor pseudopilin GspI [Lacimicrobium alkaliphilum]GGD76943.1 type II secretion system protein GspI [Lacimicrobium alkaliphilum]
MKSMGMTLLEVMVALLIFAITGTAVMKAASEHLNNITVIEDVTFATWVANNRLARMQLEGRWPPQNNAKGTEELADRTWHWRQVVTETTDKDMRSVEIEVRLQASDTDAVTSVATFVTRLKGSEDEAL